MSIFLNPDKSRKSPIVMYGFIFAIIFGLIYGLCYSLLVEPLYGLITLGGNEKLATLVQCLIIAALGTAVCNIFFLLKDKRIVPAAYAFLTAFTILFYLAALKQPPESRAMMAYLVTMYALAPVVLGNALSWVLYLKFTRAGKRGSQEIE